MAHFTKFLIIPEGAHKTYYFKSKVLKWTEWSLLIKEFQQYNKYEYNSLSDDGFYIFVHRSLEDTLNMKININNQWADWNLTSKYFIWSNRIIVDIWVTFKTLNDAVDELYMVCFF
jgi:hypothetical protein